MIANEDPRSRLTRPVTMFVSEWTVCTTHPSVGGARGEEMLSHPRKKERVAASQVFAAPTSRFSGDKKEFVEDIKIIVSYAQGFMVMKETAKELGWKFNSGSIVLMWRGGCIIRSVFEGNIKQAFDKNPSLSNLLVDSFFKEEIAKCQTQMGNFALMGTKKKSSSNFAV